jgi:NADPH:quinone reductase-like Zn-dependent oxidoreductase
MKAVLCKTYGPPESLVVEDVPSPEAGPGEVVVSVKAASVNFPDVLIIQNKYQVKPPLPFSPGSELAGVVKAVGDGMSRFKPGDRVMAITAVQEYRLWKCTQVLEERQRVCVIGQRESIHQTRTGRKRCRSNPFGQGSRHAWRRAQIAKP